MLVPAPEVPYYVLHVLTGLVQHDEVDDEEGGMEDKVETADQDRACLDTKLYTSHVDASS